MVATCLRPRRHRSESLVADAAAAHLIYAAEKRHAVEVPASEEAHLATWLGRRLAVPLRIPHLGDTATSWSAAACCRPGAASRPPS